ncbi:hypothetical protein OKW96_08690 [Sphingobacterium sp. KU25419]|nr:hypothetical protein OKW96_08690 [Sphingobacterium sp. KU25419]
MERSNNIRPLKLNIKTVAVLDNKAMQEIKGGRSFAAEEASCTSGSCRNSCRSTEIELNKQR